MAYHWSSGDVRTRQHRAATAPAPSQPPFSAIPPSLIPGRRHQTFSATTNGLLYSGPGSGSHSMVKVPANLTPGGDGRGYYSMNPSPYHDVQPPPPPLPLPQSLLPQSLVPPRPPKAPFIMPPKSSPTLPPKPPSFMPPPDPLRPGVLPRSQSQPPPLTPHGASPPLDVPLVPPPPVLPPKPLGARTPSFTATRPQPNVSPRAKPSLIARESPDTNDTAPLTLPSANSPVKGSLGINEEEELELALELSKHTEREHANSLLSHDEDLARALERSLLDPAPRPLHPRLRPELLIVNTEPVIPSSSAKPWDAPSRSQKPVSHGPNLSPVDVQLKEDEAFARRLEAQYHSEPTTPTPHNVDPKPSENPPLPRYADIVGKETAANHLEPNATAPRVPAGPLTSARSHERLLIPDQANIPRNTPPPAQRTSPRPESQATTVSPGEQESPEASPTSPQPPRTVVTPIQFVDPELLYGVSIGPHTPPTENFEMRGPLPNVIALSYGKSSPMHIRASNWRQLLVLMAKLGNTEIQPSVEASAATKGNLYLRTVIQFFKIHPASTDWRTVIYLTIDYPPPPDYKFANDVNVLPYSYGLSTLPALLRDGPTSQISKYYTIPETSGTPLPKLPISLPNMAMYLASVLEESRRAAGDSSSGLRRLAKMINHFYPSQESPGEEEEHRRRGGRAFIGRLMGRTSRPPQGGRNAEVYDLVTPFVSEWG